MEKLLIRTFGVIWIVMIVFLLFTIKEKPSESGMTISFIIMSIAMVYYHFSGQFDPDVPTTAQHC